MSALAERPFHVLVGCTAMGLALAETRPEGVALSALVGFALLGAVRAPRLGAGAATLVVAGALVGDWRLAAIDGSASRVSDGTRVGARAHLLSSPRPGRFGSWARRTPWARAPLPRTCTGAESPASCGSSTPSSRAGAAAARPGCSIA